MYGAGIAARTLDLSPDSPQTGKLDVVVDMTSLDTGDKDRDDTLRGADLFSIAKFPQAHFTATQITKKTVRSVAVRGFPSPW